MYFYVSLKQFEPHASIIEGLSVLQMQLYFIIFLFCFVFIIVKRALQLSLGYISIYYILVIMTFCNKFVSSVKRTSLNLYGQTVPDEQQ